MIGPQIQGAVYAALTAADVAGDRVYDRPPASPVFPYVVIGDEQVIDTSGTCGEAFDVFVDVHVWSRASSSAEAKTIGAQVAGTLATELTIADFRVVIGALETARYLKDPDGITTHGVITFRYAVETT
ncbi:DUF3168 domain-containing protein [Aurantimonas sp. A2-1-M11]|uniref:DUF3168 domain-containing protein n=1 Tax=Aurantimonas sp. A2-1-M11 TaxID=3113712 RepID=UPI002F92FB8F